MEEILASIRRIISEDASQAGAPAGVSVAAQPAPVAAPAPVPVPAPEPVVEREPEVLELTNIVTDDGTVGPELAPEPEPMPEPPRRRPQPEPLPEPRVSRRAPEPRHMRNQSDLDMVDKDDGILSSQASSAITNAFGMLSRERDVSVSGASLEEIVTQIMKPLLAQWLDEHLPEIVERVVQQEIERAARSSGRRR
jgi:cell pole-organizing protein PopZ